MIFFFQYKLDKYDFFPLNHALVLEGSKEDTDKTKLDEILNYVQKMKSKLDEEVNCFVQKHMVDTQIVYLLKF